MQPHLQMNVLCCLSESKSNLSPLLKYLKKMTHVRAIISEKLPADLSKFQVVITAPASAYNPAPKKLEQFVVDKYGYPKKLKMITIEPENNEKWEKKIKVELKRLDELWREK